ncbi:MAG: diguanylate cyclase [bacterium]
MSFEWYKNLITSFKDYNSKIDKIESSMLGERVKFKELYERNLQLEQQIAERTDELNQANRGLISLNHIWETMNSSEPLSGVLTNVTQGLAEGLNYLSCFIFQLTVDNNKEIIKVRIVSKNSFLTKIEDILCEKIEAFEIPFSTSDNIIVQSIKTKTAKNTKSFRHILYGCTPYIKSETLEALDNLIGNRNICVLPLYQNNKPFGCLMAISIRAEISNIEKNFLKLFADQTELAVTIAGLFEQIRDQAVTDPLTKLFNRRHFDQCLASEADRSVRLKQPFSIITLDLDHLKFINDTYGHNAGDAAIKMIGLVLYENARSIDVPARCGGEEFAVILPGVDLDGALIAAERLRVAIETSAVEGVGRITASIGVGTFFRHTDSIGELLELVDQAMYRAKRNGRNQVQIALANSEMDWRQIMLDTFMDMLAKQHVNLSQPVVKEITKRLKSEDTKEKSLIDCLSYIVDNINHVFSPMYQLKNGEKLYIIDKICKKLEMIDSEIEKIKIASLLHDLGNLIIPENLLLKPGPISSDEKKFILNHPIITAKEILKPLNSANHIVSMLEYHHEHWSGAGYPGNLAGENIPVGSRILFILDAYFAMVSNRPHRKALTNNEALQILKEGANNEWDGKIIDLFINVLAEMKEVS